MQSKKYNLRASLVELFTRLVVFNKSEKVYNNGDDNLYPYEIDRVIPNSPTASMAQKLMTKFIGGEGVVNDFVANRKTGAKMSEVVLNVADDLSAQNGAFVWFGYGVVDGVIKPITVEVLNYADCRISKEDDNDYPGVIVVSEWNAKKKFVGSKKEKDWYYPANSNSEVVMDQMRKDSPGVEDPAKLVQNYRGQVMYINNTPRFKYALSPFDSAFNDMDSEYRFSLYTNTQFRTGFLGKTMVVFRGLDKEKEEQEQSNVAKWLGAENSGNAYTMFIDEEADIDKVVKIIQPTAQFDDKLFEVNAKRIKSNILGCANNLPEPLVTAGDGAIFGTNADAYRELRNIYSENCKTERNLIENSFAKMGFEIDIIPVGHDDIRPE